TTSVAARDERRLRGPDPAKSLEGVFSSLNPGRIRLGPDEQEIVVHHLESAHPMPFCDEFLLERVSVHEHDIRIPAAADVERLPGSDRDYAHLDAGLLRE